MTVTTNPEMEQLLQMTRNPQDPLMTMSSELSIEQLSPFLAELRLNHWGKMIQEDLVGLMPQEQKLLMKSISKWVLAERAEKKAAQIASKIRSAKFKRIQTVDNFDFSHSKVTQGIQKAYLALHSSISSKELPSAVFSGNAGLGKTHLARSLGYAACQKGLSTLFLTASEMVNQLSHAQKTYNLETELNRYRRPQVLIIDELGYVSLDAQASNLFFQVLSARHDQGLGTIATTNLPFGKFNQIFANDAIAHAIVDRLVNDAEVFFMEGSSYREHQRQEKQKRKPKS